MDERSAPCKALVLAGGGARGSQFICHYSRKPLHMPSMGLPMLHDTGWAEYRCRSPETGPKFRPHYHIYMV